MDLPVQLRDEPAVKLVAVLWVIAGEQKIVGMEAIDRGEGTRALVDLLFESCKRPAWGSPRRPGRLRVEEEDQARALRAAVGTDPDVVVGAVPEIEDVAEHLLARLAADGPGVGPGSYLGDGRIAKERVADFFEAAARAFSERPWSVFHEAAPFCIDCPAVGLSDAVLLTAGGGTDCPGLMLLDSLDDYLAVVEDGSEETPAGGAPGFGVPIRMVGFGRGADLPDGMRREVLTHGWKIASAHAYPKASVFDAEGRIARVAEHDIVALTVCLDSVAKAAKERPNALCDGAAFALDVPVRTRGGPAVARLTWPHPGLGRTAPDDDDLGGGDGDDDFGEVDYDGETDPDPVAWQKAGDDHNRLAIERHHRRDRPHGRVPSLSIHCLMHLVVENQLAADDPPEARRALARLRAGGLGRHEAIHAIASVSGEEMFGLLQHTLEPDPARYGRALEALDAEIWKAGRTSTRTEPEERQGSSPRRKRASAPGGEGSGPPGTPSGRRDGRARRVRRGGARCDWHVGGCDGCASRRGGTVRRSQSPRRHPGPGGAGTAIRPRSERA